MTDMPSEPVMYLKQGCPFCFKLRLFLLEAGLLDAVEIREFAPDTDEERAIRTELEPYLKKTSFPAAMLSPGRYVADSDEIIGELSAQAGIDPARLPTLQAYLVGPFKSAGALFRENMELKKRLG